MLRAPRLCTCLRPLTRSLTTGITQEVDLLQRIETLSRDLHSPTTSKTGDALTAHSFIDPANLGYWAQKRQRAQELLPSTSTISTTIPSSRKMKDSFMTLELKFEEDPQLLETYIGAHGSVRTGRLMEDLDSMAGSCAYKHCLPDGAGASDSHKFGFYLVTAAVDRLDMLRPLNPDQPENIRISGHVVYTGISSLEVFITMTSLTTSETLLIGRFTMVARKIGTNTSHAVPKIEVSNSTEGMLRKMGEDLKERKGRESGMSLQKIPPTEEESAFLHWVFCGHRDVFEGKVREAVWMKDTAINSCLMVHPQERNVHGKAFGGYLMRMAYETAYSTACLFARSSVTFLSLDELAFKQPVEIGSLLKLTSSVTYSPINDYASHKSFQVAVEASTCNLATGEEKVTNTFHFTFSSKRNLERFVMPSDYFEGMKMIEAKRRRETGIQLRQAYQPISKQTK